LSRSVFFESTQQSPTCAGLLLIFQLRWTELILLFSCLLAIPLARECFLDALLFTGLQVEAVTLHFLDDVLGLHLALEAPQCIFKRLAFLYANLCQI
jgi:hypothetical protein